MSAKTGIAIAGATGPTGRLVVERLAALEVPVFALVRNAAERPDLAELPAVGIIDCDAMDPNSANHALRSAAAECGAVLNLLGGNPFSDPGNLPDHAGVVNVTNAAVAAGIDRYILVTSVGTGASWPYVPDEAFIRPMLELKSKAEEHLKATSLAWTIVKPGGLGPPDYRVPTGEPLITENHGVRGLIDRADLADVIVRVLAAPPPRVLHRELYAVVDRIEHHEGTPEPFELPELAEAEFS